MNNRTSGKTMKNKAIIAIASSLALVLLLTCRNPFSPPNVNEDNIEQQLSSAFAPAPEGMGTFSFLTEEETDVAKTILPTGSPVIGDFTQYVITFTPVSGGGLLSETRSNLSEPFYLIIGTYNLEVIAYINSEAKM